MKRNLYRLKVVVELDIIVSAPSTEVAEKAVRESLVPGKRPERMHCGIVNEVSSIQFCDAHKGQEYEGVADIRRAF